MNTTTWRFENDSTLAAYVPLDAFRGVLEQRLALSPDQAGILIRDGQIVAAYQGAHFSIGGLWNKLKELVGGRHALQLLVADLKPFQLQPELHGISRDHVGIGAGVTLDLQLDPEKPVNILGLIGHHGTLSKIDVYARLSPHLQERVFQTALAQVEASTLRGNRTLQEQLEADCRREVERVAGDLGVRVRAVTFGWTLNAEEITALEKRAKQRADEMLEFDYQRAKRELECEQETTLLQLRATHAAETLRAANASELQLLLQRGELDLIDARSAAERIGTREQLRHELELAKLRRADGYEQALGEAQTALERSRIETARSKLEFEFKSFQVQEELRLDRLRAEQELVLRRSAQEGELDIAARAREQQLKTLREMQDLKLQETRELRGLDREDHLLQHSTRFERERHQAQVELEKLRLQGAMEPDQILAIQAGAAPEVAKVFAERAKATAASAAEKEQLLREMVRLSQDNKATSEAQAQRMFDSALSNIAKVGSAVAGARPEPGTAAAAGEPVECTHCHHKVPVTDRFCKHCGTQLRT